MRVLSTLAIAVVLPTILPAPAHAASTNLIVNGSFETPDVSPGVSPAPVGGWEVFYSPILGWTPVNGNGLEIQDHVIGRTGVAWSAYDGNQVAEMDGYANGGMFQTVPTIPGQGYNLGFAYSPRPDLILASSGTEVWFNDVRIDTIWTDGTGLTNTVWLTRDYTVTATGTSSTIKFMATGLSDGGSTLIDNVQFLAVPAPPTGGGTQVEVALDVPSRPEENQRAILHLGQSCSYSYADGWVLSATAGGG